MMPLAMLTWKASRFVQAKNGVGIPPAIAMCKHFASGTRRVQLDSGELFCKTTPEKKSPDIQRKTQTSRFWNDAECVGQQEVADRDHLSMEHRPSL